LLFIGRENVEEFASGKGKETRESKREKENMKPISILEGRGDEQKWGREKGRSICAVVSRQGERKKLRSKLAGRGEKKEKGGECYKQTKKRGAGHKRVDTQG